MTTLANRLLKLETIAGPVHSEPRRVFSAITSPSRREEADVLLREHGYGERENDFAIMHVIVSPSGQPEWDAPIEINGPN